MKKIALLLATMGMSSVAVAGQRRPVPSINRSVVTASFAVAYRDTFLAKYDPTPIWEMPGLQSMEEASRRLDAQCERSRKEAEQFEEMRLQRNMNQQ